MDYFVRSTRAGVQGRMQVVLCFIFLTSFQLISQQLPASVEAGIQGQARTTGPVGADAKFILSKAAHRSVYIQNKGQWDSQAMYLLRRPGVDFWLTRDGMVYDLQRRTSQAAEKVLAATDSYERQVVRMRFEASNVNAETSGSEQAEGVYNYMIGNDESRWATNVPLYAKVRVHELYRGVDVQFYLENGLPRYDLLVSPGADVSQIRARFEGAQSVEVLANGNLMIHTQMGDIEQQGLLAYQMVGEQRKVVPCRFELDASGAIRFVLGTYDQARELVIDPI